MGFIMICVSFSLFYLLVCEHTLHKHKLFFQKSSSKFQKQLSNSIFSKRTFCLIDELVNNFLHFPSSFYNNWGKRENSSAIMVSLHFIFS